MSEKNKLPTTDTEDFNFLVDHFDPTTQEKKVAEDILNLLKEDGCKKYTFKIYSYKNTRKL
jgi:hypothetical protein